MGRKEGRRRRGRGLRAALESIADAEYGLDIELAVGLETLAQAPDMYVQRTGAHARIVRPHGGKKVLAGNQFAGMADETGEQIELLARQFQAHTIQIDSLGLEVH